MKLILCLNSIFSLTICLQELVHGYTSMAIDYSNELEKWASTDYYDDHVNKIQLPYAQVPYKTNFIFTVSLERKY